MKQFFFLLTLVFISFFDLHAQVEVLEATEVEMELDTTKSLLWEITGKDLTKPSYLYGTIHMIDKEDFFLTDSTLSAFDRSEKVVFEINMDDMTDMGAQMSMLMKAFMPNGTTLKTLLNAEDYKVVSDHFDKMGMPMMFLERIKPMFLSVLASGDMSPGDMQNGSVVSYELELNERAKTQKKPVAGLETMDFQMSMFDSIPYTAQAQMLVDGIKMGSENDGQFEKMIEIYKAQDIEAMQTLVDEDADGIGEYETLLLVNRNINWIPIMAEMMQAQTTFFAVGAGHLGGQMGVIQLLKKEGYTVKPIL